MKVKAKVVRLGYPTSTRSDEVDVRPMEPPKPFCFPEILYNGKTSKQLFDQDVAAGVYKKPHLETRVEYRRRTRMSFVLDGPPEPEMPIERVELILSEVYVPVSEHKGIETRYSKVIKSWPVEEWFEGETNEA